MGNRYRGTERYTQGAPRYYGGKIVLGMNGSKFLLAENDILRLGDYPDRDWLIRGATFEFEPGVYLELVGRSVKASIARKGPLYWVKISLGEKKEIVTYKHNYCDMIGTDDIWGFAEEYKEKEKDKTMEQVVNDLWNSVQGLKDDLRKFKIKQDQDRASFSRLYKSDKEYLVEKINQNEKFNDNNSEQIWKRIVELEIKSVRSIAESHISSVKKQEEQEEVNTYIELVSDFREWMKGLPDDNKFIPLGINQFLELLSKKYTVKK